MKTNRIVEHPVLGKLENQKPVTFTFDGKRIQVLKGIRLHRHFLQMGLGNSVFMNKVERNELSIVILDIALSAVSRSIKHRVFAHV